MRYLFFALAGAIAMYFYDPDRGAARRNVTRDRFMGTARDVGDDIERTARKVSADAYGVSKKIEHGQVDKLVGTRREGETQSL